MKRFVLNSYVTGKRRSVNMRSFMAVLCRFNGSLTAKKYFGLSSFFLSISEIACTNIMTSLRDFERAKDLKMLDLILSLLKLLTQNIVLFSSLIT